MLLALLAFCGLSAFAQEPRKPEFFVGYSNLQGEGLPDTNDPNNFISNDFLNRRTTLHGINGGITLFPFQSFGITGDISFNRKHESIDVTAGSNSQNTDIWYFLAGPSYVFPSSGRFQPFGRIMGGVAHTSFEASVERAVSGGTSTNSFDVGSTDFAMGIGGGLDVRVGDKLKVRIIQIDYSPVFLGDRAVSVLGQAGILQPVVLEGQRQDNLRLSFGVTF
jgi:opacity protein-like surface antigen